ncbi:MAG TPA: DUF3857 domain-containing protein [Thermoanaerobaculaceae bacterium]|nr:DUF3857 domain-containing protein [Thermoanaerobaculaceae bacterium]
MRRMPLAPRALVVSAAALSLAPVAALSAQAQRSTPPRAFAAAAGPDAEYLSLTDRYTLRADGAVVHERRSRLQVNSYLAINRKWGESKVPYDPAVDTFEVLSNRTVLPSGAAVQAPANAVVDDQPPGAEHDPLWSGLRRKVIVHTALEPGAVIEEAWRVTRAAAAAPWLELAEPLALEPPIRSRVVEVDVPAGTPLRWQALGWLPVEPTRATASGRDVWRWALDDVAAFPPEPSAPPEPPVLVASTCDGRAALERELGRRIGAAGAPEGLLAVAREAAAKNPGREAGLLAVFDAVTDRMTVAPVPPSEQHFAPRPPAEVWRSGVATPLELAELEAEALGAAGFRASPAVGTSTPGRDLARCPALAGLDRALVVVAWDGEGARFYDPVKPGAGWPLEAPGAIADLVTAAPHPREGSLAWPARSRTAVRVVAEVAADGTVKGTFEFAAEGGATPHAALVRDPARLGQDLAGVLPDGRAANVRVTGLRRNGATVVAGVEGKLPSGNALGLVRWTLPEIPAAPEVKLPQPPLKGRESPVAFPEACGQELDVVLSLPKGWSVAALPAKAEVANDTGTVATGGETLADGRVRLHRAIAVRRLLVPAAQADQVRALATAWLSPAGRELILRVPTEKK